MPDVTPSSTTVVGKLTEIDGAFSTNATDLANALTQLDSSAHNPTDFIIPVIVGAGGYLHVDHEDGLPLGEAQDVWPIGTKLVLKAKEQ